MRKCPCPVWIPNPAGRTCERILVAIDPLEEQPTQRALNLSLLETAGALARMDGAKLIVKTVVDVPGETFLASAHYRIPAHEIRDHADDLTRRATEALRELARAAGLDELRPDLKVVTGNLPGDEIARTVHAEHIDLLVMGSVHRAGVAGLFMGNNAERILQQISCGVFTAKPTPIVTLGG
jgi:universal stress protein E